MMVASIIIIISLFFIITSIIGLIRMPNFYTKLHASGIADSFAIPLLLIGVSLLQDSYVIILKIILIILSMLILGPVNTHAIANSRYLKYVKNHAKIGF